MDDVLNGECNQGRFGQLSSSDLLDDEISLGSPERLKGELPEHKTDDRTRRLISFIGEIIFYCLRLSPVEHVA